MDEAERWENVDLVAGLIQLAPAFDAVTAATLSMAEAADSAAKAAAEATAAELTRQAQERNFATGVDYRRGMSRASNGIGIVPQDSAAQSVVELKALNARIDLLHSTSEITAASTGATANNTEDTLTVLETTT